MRESIIVQETEEAVIAVLDVFRLNSAYGRLRSSFSPNSDDVAIRDSIHAMLEKAQSPLDFGPLDHSEGFSLIPPRIPVQTSPPLSQEGLLSFPERQDLREAKVDLLRNHSRDLNHMLSLEERGVGNEFLQFWLFNATTFEVSARGSIETPIQALCDVTREELDVSKGVQFHNTRSGSGPFSDKLLQSHVRNMPSPFFAPSPSPTSGPSESLSSSSSDTRADRAPTLSHGYPAPSSIASRLVAREYGCMVNLFGLSTNHEDVVTAIYYWLRHLRIVENPVICMNSSKVCAFLWKLLEGFNLQKTFLPALSHLLRYQHSQSLST